MWLHPYFIGNKGVMTCSTWTSPAEREITTSSHLELMLTSTIPGTLTIPRANPVSTKITGCCGCPSPHKATCHKLGGFNKSNSQPLCRACNSTNYTRFRGKKHDINGINKQISNGSRWFGIFGFDSAPRHNRKKTHLTLLKVTVTDGGQLLRDGENKGGQNSCGWFIQPLWKTLKNQ